MIPYANRQRNIARLALQAAGAHSRFALAGSGAIREHGLIDRPTEDVDLFTVQGAVQEFGPALDRIVHGLHEAGYKIDVHERRDSFARLSALGSDGVAIELDLGVDWRAQDPVMLDIGPVLSPDDAVGNKTAALFSRGEARDYLDVDRIRRSGQYTDECLLELAERADPGFDRKWFAHRLSTVDRLQQREVEPYGVTPQQLEDIKTRCRSWGKHLHEH